MNAGGFFLARGSRLFAAALGLALALRPQAPLRAQNLEEGERLQFADGLYARGMYELALKEYEAFLKDFPAGSKADAAHFRIGETCRRMGNLDAAEEQYRYVFDHCPGSQYRLKAGFKRADLCLEREQFQAAVDLYRAVLKENPPEDIAAPALYFLGTALQKLHKSAEAADAYEQLRQRHPSSNLLSYALLALGQIYAEQVGPGGREQGESKALECYRLAAEKPATDRVGAEALFQMGELHFRRGAFDKSAEVYARLLKRYASDHRCAQARLQAAWATHKAGQYAESLRTADERLQAGPFTNREDEAEWLYLKAGSERQLGRHEEAVRTYARMLEQFPASRYAPPARYEKALAYYKLSRFEDAIADLEKVELTGDLRKDVYWLFAQSYEGVRQPDKANACYRRIVTEFPAGDVACDAAYRLAFNLQAKEEHREAARFYGMVATNCPQSPLVPAALLAAGICEAKGGDEKKAVGDWSLLIRKYPQHAAVEDALYQKGMSEIRLKRDADAIASFRQLVQQFPKSKLAADAGYWEGSLLKEAGKWPEAEAALRRALSSSPPEELAREAQFHLANVLQKLGRPAEAAKIYTGLLASPLRGEFPPAMLAWLAEYTFEQKDYRGSAAAARQLVANSREPNWQQIGWGLAGRAELAAGDRAAAADALKKCLDVKAATRFAAESALQLGDISWSERSYSDAAAYFSRAASLATTEGQIEVRARAYAGLGRAAKAEGDASNAARYFMSVAILYDDANLVPECLYEAAQAFQKSGRAAEAAKALDELKRRYPDSEWARRAGP